MIIFCNLADEDRASTPPMSPGVDEFVSDGLEANLTETELRFEREQLGIQEEESVEAAKDGLKFSFQKIS